MTWRDEARAAWGRLLGRDRSAEAALDSLSDIGSLRRLLDRAELEAVRDARSARRSWTEIATRVGITRQSAWERWRDLDDDRPVTQRTGGSVSARPLGGVDPVEDIAAAVLAETADDLVGTYLSPELVTVPDVVGFTWQQARVRLVEQRLHPLAADPELRRTLRPDSTGYVVTGQRPAAGEQVPARETILLQLTAGPGDAGVRAPLDPPPPPRARRGAIDESTGESVR